MSDPTRDDTGGVAVAFPGQGIDGRDLAAVLHDHDGHPLVDRLAALLGSSDWDGLEIDDTRVGQPAVFVGSVLSASDPAHQDRLTDVRAAFGHSLGELSAAAYAGVFDPADGLDLVVKRAELGHTCNEARPGRMIVVMRLDAPQVEWVRRDVVSAGAGVLELAVINGTGQFVLSGDVDATDVALERIADLGGVGRRLPIGGAYHSPLMRGVVDAYREAIEATATKPPSVPLVSCTTQATITDRATLIDTLARALVLPVRWVETLEAVRALGIGAAIDAGPSQTLTNLAKFTPVLSFTSLRPDPAPRSR